MFVSAQTNIFTLARVVGAVKTMKNEEDDQTIDMRGKGGDVCTPAYMKTYEDNMQRAKVIKAGIICMGINLLVSIIIMVIVFLWFWSKG